MKSVRKLKWKEKNWIQLWASKIMSHNNYKKMIFQQTINWLTDLMSHNLLCKLVYWLCYLIEAIHTHCYLFFSWMKDVCRDFRVAGYSWELGGYSILAPMDRTLESKWNDPVDTSWNSLLEAGFSGGTCGEWYRATADQKAPSIGGKENQLIQAGTPSCQTA